MRRVVQIAVDPKCPVMYAVCEDGTVWLRDPKRDWEQCASIPGPSPESTNDTIKELIDVLQQVYKEIGDPERQENGAVRLSLRTKVAVSNALNKAKTS